MQLHVGQVSPKVAQVEALKLVICFINKNRMGSERRLERTMPTTRQLQERYRIFCTRRKCKDWSNSVRQLEGVALRGTGRMDYSLTVTHHLERHHQHERRHRD